MRKGICNTLIAGIVFFLYPLNNCAALPVNGNSDTISSYASIDLMLAVLKHQSSFTQGRLVHIIDSLMDMDTVPYEYYIGLTNCFAKNNGLNHNKNTNEISSVVQISNFYCTWDNKNFYNEQDLLKNDTTVNIVLLDSIHNSYVHPCEGIVTSRYGWRDNAMHNGIDVDLNKGDKVLAAFDGVVRMALRHHGYGNVVVVRHYNGLETTYAHLSKIKVKVGQQVKAGAVVGLGGSTGKSTGTHLHFEVRFKGVPINPSNIISFNTYNLCSGNEITIRKNKWGVHAYPKDSKFYTVQKGDTIYDIAKKYGLTTSYLRELNGLSKKQYLKVGYQLRVA